MSLAFISVNNVWTYVSGLPDRVVSAIRKEFRYHPEGYFYSELYKSRRWDGYVYLFSNKTNRIRSGMYERIRNLLDERFPEIRYIINDNRTIVKPQQTTKVRPTKLSFTPRDYQKEIAEEVFNYDKRVIELPTGAGKTKLAACLIHKNERPSLFVVPNLLLLYQAYDAFSKDLGIKPGMVGDGRCIVSKTMPVVVCTAQTLSKVLNLQPKKNYFTEANFDASFAGKYEDFMEYMPTVRMVIWDEVHHTAADLYYEATEQLINVDRIYGLSATPYRKDGATMKIEAASGPTISLKHIDLSFGDLFTRKVLCKPIIYSVAIPEARSVSKTQSYQVNYKYQVTDNTKRHKIVADIVKKYKKAIIAVTRIKHGNNMYKVIGSSAVECYSSSKNLQKRFDEFRSGKKSVLISTLVDEGFDISDIDCVVIAAPCSDAVQQIGRAIRMHPGKKSVDVYIIDDNAHTFARLNHKRYNSWRSRLPKDVVYKVIEA